MFYIGKKVSVIGLSLTIGNLVLKQDQVLEITAINGYKLTLRVLLTNEIIELTKNEVRFLFQ